MRIEEFVCKYYDKLNHNDIYIWKYISANKVKCAKLTIDELAQQCNVSRSTILRFAQKLSFKGYSELKIHLRWELEEKNEVEEDCIERVANELNRVIDDLKNKDLTSVCNRMYEANRVFVYGTGAVQNSVASELKRTFLCGDKCIYHINGYAETDIMLNTITSDDLVVLISLTGESERVIDFANKLKIANIPMISVTKFKNNQLARISDENLYINTSIVNIGTEVEYEVTTGFFLLVEILFLKYIIYKNNMKNL